MRVTLDTFIIADTHFGHKKVLSYEPSRMEILGDEPDDRMVRLWNETVGTNDTVLHLGDFAWGVQAIAQFASKLNGTKYLIRGNHDKGVRAHLKNGFSEMIDFSAKGKPAYWVVEVDGIRILFSHYPIISDGYDDTQWKILSKIFDAEHCDINIHGHIHSMLLDEAFCINTSVEAIGFKPVRLSELLSMFQNGTK